MSKGEIDWMKILSGKSISFVILMMDFMQLIKDFEAMRPTMSPIGKKVLDKVQNLNLREKLQ